MARPKAPYDPVHAAAVQARRLDYQREYRRRRRAANLSAGLTSNGTDWTRRRRDWGAILDHAAEVVGSYNTGVTLRQLFYRLVADQTLGNNKLDYQDLSRRTAVLRRLGRFPELVDRRRSIDRPAAWATAAEARQDLRDQFRLDRTEGQPHAVYLGCEKDALSALLASWMDQRGIPVIILGGWSSEGYEREIKSDVGYHAADRPSVLLYLGDLDPAGEAIEHNVQRHVRFDEVVRIALTNDQKVVLDLPENDDPEALAKLDRHPGRKAFLARYGRLFQVEVDAIPPDTLRTMVESAIDGYHDQSAYDVIMERERVERARL